ncbi:MAG: carboxypeptidase regulatory-like domain-containing protein [Elusimicrobia bacterium]|nr:carboxypeptidase regulatory-like domain-containing protein [Elusimicrobiota bacterium]
MGRKKSAAFLALLLFPQCLPASDITILVKDNFGNALAGATTVYAVVFGDTGPDGDSSTQAFTNNLGSVTFSLPNINKDFHFFAVHQTSGPTLRNQMFSPYHTTAHSCSGCTNSNREVRLGQALSNVGIVTATVSGATANKMLFGNMKKAGSGTDVAIGACVTDGAGGCGFYFFNVASAPANTYEVGVYDPVGDIGDKQTLTLALNTNAKVGITLDISGGLGQDTSASSGDQSVDEQNAQQEQFGVSVDGVLVSTDTGSPNPPIFVSWTGISLKVKEFLFDGTTQFADRFWAHADQNGRFKFFGLTQGTTYYVSTMAGCSQNGSVCFEGLQSTATLNAGTTDLALNDFLYTGGTLQKKIRVRRAPAGTGKMLIGVKDNQGRSIPGSWISVWPDWSSWHTDPAYNGGDPCDNQMHFGGVDISSPGLAGVNMEASTGYVQLTNLRPGNYQVQVWTRFSNEGRNYNAGVDGIWNWQWGHRGCESGPIGIPDSADDLRVFIPEAANSNVQIYNTLGTLQAATSITVVVPLSTQPKSGVVNGTLIFPQVVNLSDQPITITIQKQCKEGEGESCWNKGGYDVIGDDETPAASYNYSIAVDSAAQYWVQVTGKYWGVVRDTGERDNLDLKSSTYAVRNMKFAPAGRLVGYVYKPDRSRFIPGQDSFGNYLGGNINANSEHNWAWGQVSNDGGFQLGGLLPGQYQVQGETWGGNVTYANPEPAAEATIVANQDAAIDFRFVNGQVVLFQASTVSLPALSGNIVTDGGNRLEGEQWKGVRVTAGTSLESLAKELLVHETEELQFEMKPSSSAFCRGNLKSVKGWCPAKLPDGKIYDIYLVRQGDMYGWEVGQQQGGTYFYFTLVNSTKNIIVDSVHATTQVVVNQGGPSQGTTLGAVLADLTPAGSVAPGATIRGSVAASNFMRQEDFQQLGGDFDQFVEFIPLISVLDENGKLAAAGMVTPCPEELPAKGQEFERTVQRGDWDGFRNLLNSFSCGWGYEIRGLSPNKTYTLAGTTPNYPPFSRTVSVLGNATTSTVNINWDGEVGSGATISGVVQSTAGVKIANATVLVESKGFKKRAVTDVNGSYKAEGLALGRYAVSIEATDYVPAITKVVANSAGSFVANFTLKLGGASIEGTVREFKLTNIGPVLAPVSGARILAFDDTANQADVTALLALYKVKSSTAGAYSLTGLEPNHVYRIYCKAPGRSVVSLTTTTVSGTISGVDFTLTQKPLDVDVFAFIEGSNYKFLIANPNDFESGDAWYEAEFSTRGFDKSQAANIGNIFSEQPDGSLVGLLPLSALTTGVTYVLHIEANSKTEGSPIVTKEVEFGIGVNATAKQSIDDEITGDDSEDEQGRLENEVLIDDEGNDNSSISFPPGAVLSASSETLPSCNFVAESTSPVTGGLSTLAKRTSLISGSFGGSMYNLTLSSTSLTGKALTLNLAYDPAAVGANISRLEVRHYNPVSDSWEKVNCQVTLDPVNGTASCDIDPNSPASGFYVAGRGYGAMAAASDGRQFNPLTHSASSGTSTFAVVVAAAGAANTDGKFKQYNLPNPFNLKNKTLTLRAGSEGVASTIRGTYIVITPTASGNGAIRIYNLAGDLVRELKDTVTGNQYNYFHWDGKNDSGNDVASGVYFASIDAPGADKKKPVKMVLVK